MNVGRMVSYAGNREDVLLRRVFGDQPSGFYIDVGAGDPEDHSVTKHFYDRGWRGINIEPAKDLFERLSAERSRDVNLNLGISNRPGTMRFYKFPPERWGYSTFSAEQAARHSASGIPAEEYDVEVVTLSKVCEEHAPPEVDFLSVDVEGLEREVLEGADWSRWRPRLVMVEATQPNTTTPTHESWEHILLEAGYVFAYFDGLNRYYLRSEDAGLGSRFSVPVNLFDDFEPFEYKRQIDHLQQALADAEGRLSAEAALRAAAEGMLDSLWSELRHLRQRLDELTHRYEEMAAGIGGEQSPLGGPEQEVGPMAMTVARVLSRTAARFPAAASVARAALGGMIRVRRKLARKARR